MKVLSVPTLFISGLADQLVPPAMMLDLSNVSVDYLIMIFNHSQVQCKTLRNLFSIHNVNATILKLHIKFEVFKPKTLNMVLTAFSSGARHMRMEWEG